MSINLTDELLAKTKKGKIASAKQVFLNGDQENLQQIGEKTHQLEDAIKDITVSGGASTANAVSYNNETSGMTAITAQGAIDELAAKNKAQDAIIEGKVEKSEVATELDKKFDKENIAQEFGDSEDKVVSQSALPFRYIQNEEFIFANVDANDKLLFGILWDGTPVFGKTSAVEDRLQSQVNLLADKITTILGDDDTTSAIDTLKELKNFFASIDNTQTLTSILANLNSISTKLGEDIKNLQDTKVDKEEGKSLIEDEVKECFKVIENEEFIHAVIDSEGRLLFGIYRDSGKPYFPQNDMYHISQSEEFLWVILDAANHPLLGIQHDGTCWAAKAQWLDDIKAIKEALKTFQPKEDGKGLINLDVADSFFYISNDEYIIAVVDAENRILAGIKYDGNPYFPNHEMYSVITNEEWLYAIIDAEDKVLGGFRADDGHMVVGGIDISTFITNAIIDIADIKERTNHLSTIENDEYLSVEIDADGKVIGYTASDGSHYIHNVKSETIPTEFSHIEDPEGRTEIITDAEGKILEYRDANGVKHENSIQIENFYKNGKIAEIATVDYINNQDKSLNSLSKLEGVIDNSLTNLFDINGIRAYDSDFANKVFEAIGRKTLETGCYSNNIPCKEGDWFTRNDFGTGIVVVLDINNNILGDVKNVAYKQTFQVKASEGQDFSEAAYVVMVVMKVNLPIQKIVRAKYMPTKFEDSVRIPKLKISQDNMELGIPTYVKGKSGRYYSLEVDDSNEPISLIFNKLIGIPISELPSDFPKYQINGSIKGYLKSIVMCPIEGGSEYLFEIGENGLPLRYLKKKVNCPRILKEDNVQYYYGVDGNLNTPNGTLNIFKAKGESYETVRSGIVDTEGNKIEPHDCLVISVNPLHVISQRYLGNQVTVVDGEQKNVIALHIEEQYNGKRVWLWKSEDYPELWKDSHFKGDNADYLHNNTICLDKSGRLLLNNKHANQILVIDRTWDSNQHIGSIGDIIWKIGGTKGEGFDYDVPTRIKTTAAQQWTECHDAVVDSNGLFTLFDNENNAPSKIMEFNCDEKGKAVTNHKAYTFKSYFGRYMGSVEKLADGIFLISWGSFRSNGTPNLGIYDFKNQKVIFEMKFDVDSYSTYRVYGLKE